MNRIKSKTVVFITGAFVSHHCWDSWKTYFEEQGYTALVPPWPGKNAEALTMRSRHPDKALASVTLPEIIEYYERIVKALPEKPILIGHSFGGLLSQLLMGKNLAAAVIAVHAAPPQGVIPYELDFLISNTKALGFFTSSDTTYLISFEKWQYAFTNGMSFEDQKEAYYTIAIPESKRALRGGLTTAAKVDFKKPHVPLLFLAGSKDQCIPAHLCKRVFDRYTDTASITDFKIKDRNHFVLGLPTWKEDAKEIIQWINAN